MIPDITELNFPKKDGKQYATLTQATANIADMGEKTITTQVKIDGEIVPDFSFDWEVEFQGEKYIMPLRIPQGAKENTSLNATIDLTFQHWAIYQLKRWPFVTIQQIAAGTYLPDEEVATVQLNLKDFCTLFGQVLEYYYGNTITIDLNPAWQYDNTATLITISHTKIWNVLIDAFRDKYGVRWEIKAASDNSNTVKGGERYVIRVGYPTTEVDHIFEYGFEGGLLKVERQVQSEEIRNMLKGRGGDTNIPFRYFKNTDPNNPGFRPDPDWVEELAYIPFTNLMPATFRSYVQGWKAAHISKYPGYTAVGESNAYAPWAYRKGYTDTKFAPVEFVADEITISPATGDKQVEILPGYSPYVKKGSSLNKYGPLPDTLDNNEDIYPTLQGTGMDIAVAVEEIQSDDVAESTESDAQVSNLKGATTTLDITNMTTRRTITVEFPEFDVPNNQTAIIVEGAYSKYAHYTQQLTAKDVNVSDLLVVSDSPMITVTNAVTGMEHSGSGIPAGRWKWKATFEVELVLDPNYHLVKEGWITVGYESPKLTVASIDADKWHNTFDIWVKNIWDSARQSGETDSQYSERVWKPVLGDREGNTAKVVFTSGALVHEDYEFKIPNGAWPVYDTSKTLDEKNQQGGVIATHTSHWRIKLAKSDAELEATGLYIPSTKKQGKAGDTFVFIGTEMTHVPYVTDAEIRLDDWKKDQLGEKKEIKPTAVVTTDRVRLNNEGKPNALINQLRVGNSLRLFDKRFFNEEGKAYETLYLQSMTYTYREPTSDDAALNPDVEIVLGNEYTTSANPVTMMQGEISALQRQVGAISNIEQIVRAVGDRLYLRKDGISDRSLSPTQFFSLLTSGDFRAGLIGGAGWGFYKDENGNWVLEADRVNVRQEMQVNTLVINQAEGRGGMEIDTAAYIDGVTRVVETDSGYVCYFDQKGGTVANLFHVDDVAYCNQWTAENADLKFYKRRVTAVGADNITLSKADVNGTGIPTEGDNIIHFGNYKDATRQYVKVRDVVGGGYERYIEALNSVNAVGVEYYFVGKQAGESRWFVGNKDLVPYSGDGDGSYIEYINRKFNLHNVSLSVGTTIGDKTLNQYFTDLIPELTQEDIEGFVNAIVDPKLGAIQDQIDGVIETWFYNGVPTLGNYPASSWSTPDLKIQHLGDLYYDNDTGTAYRFSQNTDGSYYWNTITDDAITKALAAAQKAQNTANSKRRTFTALPIPPYDEGDLWVNATYGTQYSNDILRCITGKADGTAFAIADWTLASKYTDDTALNNFIAGYQTTISDIKTQIDGKAETWYQSTNPAAAWTTAADKAAHKGDLWYCTADIAGTDYKKGTTWYWSGTAWEKQDIPQSVFDTIDGKADIFISKPTSYHKNDLWFLEADYTLSNVAYKSGTLVVAKNDMGAAWSADDWIKKDRYTDDTLAQTAIDRIAGYEYLKNALLPENPTQITGGLIMSTLISLGYTDASNIRHTLAGMNGSWVDALGGRTIGSWWGGPMTDLFDANDVRKNLAAGTYATSLVRMDGSAYFAGGNIGFRADGSGWLGNDLTGIKFGSNGSMTFGSGVKFDVTNINGLQTTLNSIANWQLGLQNLLVPCDANGVELPGGWQEASQADTVNGGIKAKSLKAKVTLFSEGDLVALGFSDGGASGGGASALADLNDVLLTDPTTGQTLVYDGTHWVNQTVAAGLDETALAAYLTQHNYVTSPTLAAYLTKTYADTLYQPIGNYLTGITKPMVEAVLTGNITSHEHIKYALASSLTAHASDTTVHISATERTKWNKTATDLAAILGSDSDTIINKWEEVVAFLDTYTEADTLAGLLGNKADKTTTISAGTGLSGGGTLAANRTLSLNIASATALGGVKIGSNISVAADGTISTHAPYSHPTHTAYTIAAATGRVLSAISVDGYGHVTTVSAKTLAAADIPALPWNKITSGKPTTLAGYGITDGVNDFALAGAGNAVTDVSLSGHKLTLTKGKTFLEKRLFDALFERVDTADGTYIKAKYTLCSEGDLVALGTSNIGGGGTGGGGLIQSVYGWSGLGGTYSDTTLTDTFNAYTINKLYSDFTTRIAALESKRYLPHYPLNGGLSAVSSVTTWGVGTGTTVAEWTDAGGSCAIKLKKNCPADNKLSLLIGGTVYVNEGQDAVATQAWANGRYSLLGHTHSQYLTAHQSLSHLLRIDGSNGTAAGVSALVNKLTEGTSTPTDNDYYVAQYAGGGTTTTTYHRRSHSALWSYIKSKAEGVYAPLSHSHSQYALASALGNYYSYKLLRSDINSVYDARWNYGAYDRGDYNGAHASEYPTYYGTYLSLTSRDKNMGVLILIDTPTTNALGHVYVKTRGAGDGNVSFCPNWGMLAYTTDTVANANALGGVAASNYVTRGGEQTITGRKVFNAAPLFNHFATSQNHAAFVINQAGTNYFGMGGNGTNNVIQMAMCGSTGDWLLSDTSLTLKVIGSVQANSIAKIGGTSSQFLMADGSVKALTDITSAYVTALGTSGNSLVWVKNGAVNHITVPYASNAAWLNANTALTYGANGLQYFNINGTEGNNKTNCTPTSDWHHILRMNHGNTSGYLTDIAAPLNNVNGLYWRQIRGGTFYGWYKLLDTNNYAATLDSRYYTESESDGRFARLGSPNNLVHSGNEITMIPSGFSNDLWLNHKAVGGTGHIEDYYMGDGNTGVAGVVAKGFVKHGSSDSYLLLGGGGHKAVSDFLPRSGGSMTTTAVVANLNADLLDGHHKTDFNAVARFGTTAQPSSGYYKIKIKSTAAWMLGFKILAYQNYCFDEINISGYNYGANHWHVPSASLVCSHGNNPKSSIGVTFGYDSAWNLWVAIPAAYYAGITVTDVTNGYNQVADTHSLFEIVYEATLTGTTQTTVTASRHAMLTDNVASATNASNADKLDGYHNGEVTAKTLAVANPTTVGVTVATAKANLLAAVKGSVFGNVAKAGQDLIGYWGNDSHTTVSSSMYSVINVTPQYDGSAYGQYLLFHYGAYNPVIIGRNNGAWTSVKTLAFLSDNVASATRLQGTYSLWGQSFYGNNVSGSLSNVGSITPLSDSAYNIGTSSNQFQWVYAKGLYAKTGSWLGLGANNVDHIRIHANGNVAVGSTTDAGYKLYVAGDIYADGWLRTSGARGWYSQTHGGGWYMTDGTYIRNYNYKRLALTGSGNNDLLYLTNGAITINAYGGGAWNTGAGRINLPIVNDSSQSSLMVAYRNGTTDWIGDSLNRLFAMELLNSGTQMGFCFEGETKFTFYSAGTLSAEGDLVALSDIREKNIVENFTLRCEDIAALPLFKHTWKDRRDSLLHVGTSAQAVQRIMPEAVLDDGRRLHMDYGKVAEAGVISLARETLTLRRDVKSNTDSIASMKREMANLRRENRELRDRVAALETIKTK